jgi:hypothetical protein
MKNQVVDGAIERHCDCMFPVNTYAWDFPILAALAAPRPLLLANSDKDRIFPLDGVMRIHAHLQRIYKLYGASDRLGLFISEGPHSDTQELQVAASRWLNRWLKKDSNPIALLRSEHIAPADLKVFQTLPADQINTRIHETFVPPAGPFPIPASVEQWKADSARMILSLQEKVFNNLPSIPTDPRISANTITPTGPDQDIRIRLVNFDAAGGYRLQTILLEPDEGRPSRLSLRVMDQAELTKRIKSEPSLRARPAMPTAEAVRFLFAREVRAGGAVSIFFPRGAGATASTTESEVHMRRRFLLLGQSLEAIRVWDARAALNALRTLPELQRVPISLLGSGENSVTALLAAIFENSVTHIELDLPPATLPSGLSFPSMLRLMDMPQILALTLPRTVVMRNSTPSDWEWAIKAVRFAGGSVSFLSSASKD